jgi:hypothetical protein
MPSRKARAWHFIFSSNQLCSDLFVLVFSSTSTRNGCFGLNRRAALLMTIAEMERIDKAIWLVLAFALMLLESGAIRKNRTEASARDKQLMTNTQALVKDARDLVIQFGILMPQVTSARDELAYLRVELRTAEARRDSKTAAIVHSRIADAQKRVEEAERKVAMNLLPSVAQQVQQAATLQMQNWRNVTFKYEDKVASNPNMAPKQREQIATARRKEFDAVNQDFQRAMKGLLPTVHYLLGPILRNSQTEEDKREMAFIEAYLNGSPQPNGGDAWRFSEYLASKARQANAQ